MKYRTDFVTNSSSSSFIIAKKNLDEDQLFAIRNHSELGKRLKLYDYDMPWNIDENDKYISGYTSIDNFSMQELLRIIEVRDRDVIWSERYSSLISIGDDLFGDTDEETRREPKWVKAINAIRNGTEFHDELDIDLDELFSDYEED